MAHRSNDASASTRAVGRDGDGLFGPADPHEQPPLGAGARLQPDGPTRVEIARVLELCRDCLAASSGPFLLGEFGIVDAMYFVVLLRFEMYGVPTPEDLQPTSMRYTSAPRSSAGTRSPPKPPASPSTMPTLSPSAATPDRARQRNGEEGPAVVQQLTKRDPMPKNKNASSRARPKAKQSATKPKQLMPLTAKLLPRLLMPLAKPQKDALRQSVNMAIENPEEYVKKHRPALKQRGIVEPVPDLHVYALVDALRAVGALGEVDGRAEPGEVKKALAPVARLHAVQLKRVWPENEEHSVEEILGSFVAPPPKAVEIHNPETFGRGTAARVAVY